MRCSCGDHGCFSQVAVAAPPAVALRRGRELEARCPPLFCQPMCWHLLVLGTRCCPSREWWSGSDLRSRDGARALESKIPVYLGCPDVFGMPEAVVSAFELGQCLHVRFVSFRFALKCFAWRQTAARCFTVSQSPKTLSCARIWLKKKTECYALCFSQHALQ